MRPHFLLALGLLPCAAPGQFVLQQSHTTASLRGISAPDAGGKVAWASGTAGTVLRTVDGGLHWSSCSVPPGADKLDFRAVQAFDRDSAVVLSSGAGELSRVYRTSDGCRTWKLVFTNPESPGGFFDALVFPRRDQGWILGDPAGGQFYLAQTQDGGATWKRVAGSGLTAGKGGGGAFAASNQSLLITSAGPVFGGGGAWLFRGTWAACSLSLQYNDPESCYGRAVFHAQQLPLAAGNAASGIFALSAQGEAMLAVGGDYTAPAATTGTAAFSTDGGDTWQAAEVPPHGYRSSVAYHAGSRTWIAVGPNGTDLSRDNGRTWKPLQPNAARGDAPDADRGWNALALPWVVGAKGRVGRLREAVAAP